jgi:hypothetical protein
MAEWKKVVVSGSAAILSQVNVGANQQITTSPTTTLLSGSFSGSFQGSGAGLTGVTNATTLASLTQGTGITAFTFNGSTAQTVALKNAGSLSNNVLQKWDSSNGQLTNASLTDNGTTITGTTSIQLTGASSNLSGSFSGSFQGNGAGLTGVTATAIFPTTAKTDLATTDQIYINDGANKFVTYGNLVTDLAGSGAGTSNLTTTDTGDSLALTAQVTVTGVTASLFGTASWANNATNATTATNANNVAVTDTTSGTGPYYVMFADGTTGNRAVRVDSAALTFNATTNTLTTTASYAVQALSASFASTAPYSGLTGVPAGIVSGSSLSSPSQGSVVLTTNGVAGSTIDLGLQTGDSPSFAGATLTGNLAINNGTSTAITTTGTTAALFNTTATTVNAFGAATTLNIGAATGNTTVNNNLIVTGDFTVNGTASIIDTTNLSVEDRFIILNHGSGSVSPTQEGGIIVEGTTAGSGSAFYYDGDTVLRWGVALGVAEGAISVAANSFVVTVSGSAANPTGNPTYGGATNGFGNMYVNTSDSSIWIYA